MAKKKKQRDIKVVPNVPKKYAKVAYCEKCAAEKPVKRALVMGAKTRKAWVCISCSSILPAGVNAVTKEI